MFGNDFYHFSKVLGIYELSLLPLSLLPASTQDFPGDWDIREMERGRTKGISPTLKMLRVPFMLLESK